MGVDVIVGFFVGVLFELLFRLIVRVSGLVLVFLILVFLIIVLLVLVVGLFRCCSMFVCMLSVSRLVFVMCICMCVLCGSCLVLMVWNISGRLLLCIRFFFIIVVLSFCRLCCVRYCSV